MRRMVSYVFTTAFFSFWGASNVIADNYTYICTTTVRPYESYAENGKNSWYPTNTTHTIEGTVAKGFFSKDRNRKLSETISGTLSLKKTKAIAQYALKGKHSYVLTYVFFENGKMSAKLTSSTAPWFLNLAPAAKGQCTKTRGIIKPPTVVKKTPNFNKKKVAIKKSNLPNLPKQVQTELNRLGCNVGAADGAIGPASKRGLGKFADVTGQTGYGVSKFSDKEFLSFLKGLPSGFCN
jgi:hypothetical protein